MGILITGTTGFIGNNLLHYWQANGVEVLEVNRQANTRSTYTFDNFDNTKFHAKVWCHLAGKAKDVQNDKLADFYEQANVVLTEKIFSAFLDDSSANIFIFFSTVKAAAAAVNGILTETDELPVDEPYGSSKRKAERFLLSKPLPTNKRLVILRPVMVYGNNMDSNLYSLYSFVKRGIPYPFAAYSNSKSLLSINNLIFVVNHIVSNPYFKSGIYNVSDSEIVSTNQIIEIIGEVLGKKPKMLNIPKKIIDVIGKIGSKLHLPVNSNKIGKLTSNYIVSNQKLLNEMKCSLPFSSVNELKKTFQSFKN